MNTIHQAIADGDVNGVRRLLDIDPQCIEFPDSLGNHPLHVAAYSGQTVLVRLLLEKGADVNASGDLGKTPLHYAALDGEREVAKILLEHGADPSPTDDSGLTP